MRASGAKRQDCEREARQRPENATGGPFGKIQGMLFQKARKLTDQQATILHKKWDEDQCQNSRKFDQDIKRRA